VLATQEAAGFSADSSRFWNNYSTYYDCLYRLMPYRKLLWDAFEALDLTPGLRVLDAGCGTGNLERFIAEKNHPPVTIDAIDFSSAMLSRARANCIDLDYVRFTQADLGERLPFEDATFDRVVSIHVLYALENQDATMRELLRVLKPEGKLVLANPKPEFSWRPLAAEHFRRIRNVWGPTRKAKAVLGSLITMSTTVVGSLVMNSLVIDRRERAGEYHSMAQPELESFLEQRRVDGVATYRIDEAMAEQSLLATAGKALYA
jgi:ubiquinone/menaquinone biosynthesis C-methylase UbiE